jgi:histidinol dehydrogenase
MPWQPGAEEPERLRAILRRAEGPPPDVVARVQAIVDRVRKDGDRALVELARELDGVEMGAADLRVPRERLDSLLALERAADNIRRFHERQRERSFLVDDGDGVGLGQRVRAVAAVGLYVPGGTAAYPSSVLMNALPAGVAGVERLVAVTPPRALERTPLLAAALTIAGVDEVWAVGGAQAVAALAYGTELLEPVHKIVGPGNLWVATAKRLVLGQVGIDSFAGPSEVVVLADSSAEPAWIAADMLAQAEHDAEAAALAIVWEKELGWAIAAELDRQLAELPRREIAARSLRNYGAVFLCSGPDAAVRLCNQLAPEHVEIATHDPLALADRIHHAGALFLGSFSPEAVGDYFAGPNHVLPTCGTARFASALGVHDFVRRTSIIRYSADRLAQSGDDIVALARAEGLEGHARSVLVRRLGGRT